jgi:hypothetical protein
MSKILQHSNAVQLLIHEHAKHAIRLGNATVYVMDVDKGIAKTFIERLPERQRRPRERFVLRHARAMSEGRWKWTGDPIRFDARYQLVDGQHRMLALIESDSDFVLRDAIVIVFTADMNTEALPVDMGATRKAGDFRVMRGLNISNTVHAAILFEHIGFDENRRKLLSPLEEADIAEACPFLDELFRLDHTPARKGTLAGAIRCMRKDRDAAMAFFQAAIANTHSIDGQYSAALHLFATWLLKRDPLTSPREETYLGVKAFNLWRAGKVPKLLKYSTEYAIPEPV